MKIKNKLFRFEQFINENVQQAKSILAKIEKDETDPNYQAIMALLAGKLGEFEAAEGDLAAQATMLNANKQSPNVRDYAGWFVDLHFNKGVELDELQEIFNQVTTNKDIIKDFEKPITQLYSKVVPVSELIQDEIEKIKRKRGLKHFINELPSKQKALIDTNDNEFFELVQSFWSLPETGSFFKKVKKYTNFNDLKKSLKAAIEGGSADYSEGLAKYSKEDDIVVYKPNEEMNYILLLVFTHTALNKNFGHCQWCIKEKYQWDNYLKVKNGKTSHQQYVLIDYDRSEADVLKYIGFTTDAMGNITAAHDKADKSIMNQIDEILSSSNITKEDLAITKENKDIKQRIFNNLDGVAKLTLGVKYGLFSQEEIMAEFDRIADSGDIGELAAALVLIQDEDIDIQDEKI